IQDSAYAWQIDVEKNERVVVGLNKFQVKEGPPKGLLRVDPAVGENQVAKLRALRARRDNAAVTAALEALKVAAMGSDNLMPYILTAVKTYATLGEVCDVLRGVFGEYRPSVMF
ncbi:MAG: methylmalonyl-CoA mutase family protein, partial [Candidatus Hydrogenedentales bacterium]